MSEQTPENVTQPAESITPVDIADNDIVLQSNLGRIQENYMPSMHMSGMLSVAKVLKVHHYSGTVDVELVNSRDRITSNTVHKGKFAARLLSQWSYYDEKHHQSCWGTVEPIAIGSLVVIGYLDNMKSRPIVLGQIQRADNIQNTRPSVYPIYENQPGFERREALKHTKIYPSMAYSRFDGEGNIEFAHSSKSFYAVYNYGEENAQLLTDAHNGFDHEHLSEVDKLTGEVFQTKYPECQVPIKMLFVHRDSFFDPCRWTKLYIDEKGMARVTRDTNDGKLSYAELGEEGDFKLRRQIDSDEHDGGMDFAEITVDGEGIVTIIRSNQEGEAIITLDKNLNIEMKTEKNITMDAQGDIILKGRNIRGTASNEIVLSAATIRHN